MISYLSLEKKIPVHGCSQRMGFCVNQTVVYIQSTIVIVLCPSSPQIFSVFYAAGKKQVVVSSLSQTNKTGGA